MRFFRNFQRVISEHLLIIVSVDLVLGKLYELVDLLELFNYFTVIFVIIWEYL